MKQFVCPSCGAVNRSADGRDPREAKCGKCRNALLTGAPIEVSGAQLQSHKAATKGAALLLDVWAPWCGPCRSMAPQFATAAKQLEPDVRLLKLNSDAEPDAAGALGVSGIPALFLIRDGQVIANTTGAMPASKSSPGRARLFYNRRSSRPGNCRRPPPRFDAACGLNCRKTLHSDGAPASGRCGVLRSATVPAGLIERLGLRMRLKQSQLNKDR